MPVKLPVLKSFYKSSERIYKVISISSGTDEVILQDLETRKKYRERFATFGFAFTQVFKIGDVAMWLNRTPRSIYRYESRGLIHKQKTYPVGGGRQLRFYSLEDVWKLHEMISQLHQGRPRKDGRIVNNTMPDIGTLKIELGRRYS